MRVFLAGATGVLGVRLVPRLINAGHEVAGMTRTPAKSDVLAELGAVPVVCDVFDLDALCDAVTAFAPELVLHELTDLPDDQARIREVGSANARMRRVGTRNLLTAMRAAGTERIVAQSVAWELPGDSGAAVAELERVVLDASGVVLRYGQFHGPGTYFEDDLPDPPRIHVDEAATRTVAALDAPSGVYVLTE
jgi:nucleoside-diphosphate-sugar epimerase